MKLIRRNWWLCLVVIIGLTVGIMALSHVLSTNTLKGSATELSSRSDEAELKKNVDFISWTISGSILAAGAVTFIFTTIEFVGKHGDREVCGGGKGSQYRRCNIFASAVVFIIGLFIVIWRCAVFNIPGSIKGWEIVNHFFAWSPIIIAIFAYALHICAIIWVYAPYTRHYPHIPAENPKTNPMVKSATPENYILIANGGTGIKVAIALLEVLVSGFQIKEPENGKYQETSITIYLCDIDGDSAQKLRFKALYKQYKDLRECFNNTNHPLVEVIMEDGTIQFDETRSLNDVVTNAGNDNLLYKCLFSQDQRNMRLNKGTVGDMQIGSFMASKKLDDKVIGSIMKNSTDVYRVMIAGSIFGGTGASLTPTFFKRIKAYWKENSYNTANTLGLMLMLPYFTHNTMMKDAVEANEHDVRSRNALDEYKDYDYVAFVGGDKAKMMNNNNDRALNVKGGDKQLNPLMPQDLAAALCCIQFFRNSYVHQVGDDIEGKAFCVCSEDYKLEHLPYGSSTVGSAKMSIDRTMKALYVFLHMFRYYYLLNDGTAFRDFDARRVDNGYTYDFVGYPVANNTDNDKNKQRNNLLNVLYELCWNVDTDGLGNGIVVNQSKIESLKGNKDYWMINNRMPNSPMKDSTVGKQTVNQFLTELWEAVCKTVNKQK